MTAEVLVQATVVTGSPSKLRDKDKKWLWAVLVLGFISHAYHLFRYPLYLSDEGIYTEQAWSVLKHAKLAPYTYIYDHAMFGWLLMAGWAAILPNQFNTFGNPIATERVLMVILHLGSIFFLFEIVRRFSKSTSAAVLASLLFTLSPIAIYYQRQVLLDNVMVFWMLLSLYMLSRKDGRVVTSMLAGIAFGLALISKENAIFLLPGFWYLMPKTIEGQINHKFSSVYWWFTVSVPVGIYVLYSIIKSEFLPPGFTLSGSAPAEHVSLVYTVWWQLHRTVASGGAGSVFADLLSNSWLVKDKYLLLGGLAATVFTLFLMTKSGKKNAPLVASILMLGGYSFYLARSVLLDFYVIPLIVLICLNIGLLYGHLSHKWKPVAGFSTVAAVIAVLLVIPNGYAYKYDASGHIQPIDVYRVTLTDLQTRQIDWIRKNVLPDSKMIIDDSIWVSLHDGKPDFPYAHSHFKAASDPAIRDKIFHKSGDNIDFVILSPGMRAAMVANGNEQWILDAMDQGETVWTQSKGNVTLSVVKIKHDGS